MSGAVHESGQYKLYSKNVECQVEILAMPNVDIEMRILSVGLE